MRRPIDLRAVAAALLLAVAIGCNNNGGNGSDGGPSTVELSGVVDDGGPSTPVPGATCIFLNDDGPDVGPVTAGADGRFTLTVPAGATGRVECTPPGMPDTVLSIRVAAGSSDLDVGAVDPESTLIATILQTEIDSDDLDPAEVVGRVAELEADDDLGDVRDALNLVVDAILESGPDVDLLSIVFDLLDNGRLDDPAFADIAADLNEAIDDEVGAEDLADAIEDLAELLFGGTAIVKEGRLKIEHNATDEDTGFQCFADADPWNQFRITDPGGAPILTVNALGGLFDFGLTELYFETSEPPNDEVSVDDVLGRLDEGDYRFRGNLVGGEDRTRVSEFSHDIPAGPEVVSPEDGATGLAANGLVVSWEPVTEDIEGDPIEIAAYQVIVVEDAEPEFPQGFYRPVMEVVLPGGATQVRVPNGFLKADGSYQVEVLAIAESGNQTISLVSFETGEGGTPGEDPEGEEPVLSAARMLIEHNATDEDTGFQCFADGDPWNRLTVTGPDLVNVVRADAEGGLFDFGLTEFFFETSEPPNDEVSIEEVLARLPEGTYTFTGDMVDGDPATLTAAFTHVIPAGPELLSPADGADDVDPADTVISWEPVTEDIDGAAVQIVGYQVIVEADEPFTIFLPPSVTQVTVPAEFMRGGTEYSYEVLAIEVSGNQTLSTAEFTTR